MMNGIATDFSTQSLVQPDRTEILTYTVVC